MAWLDIKHILRDHPYLLDGRDVKLRDTRSEFVGCWSLEKTCWLTGAGAAEGEAMPDDYQVEAP